MTPSDLLAMTAWEDQRSSDKEPEPEQPWTPRERLMYAALALAPTPDDFALMAVSLSGRKLPDDLLGQIAEYRSAYSAAIAEAPPPDPRDEALEMAAQWLESAANRCESILETSPEYHLADDIANYRKAAAIARARGGR